ncbi:hypothetical protein SY89_00234 [Halolamina pelagica]|uniref:Uncharacterized protein n=1 Tax=Halolamina pelagica TaxID=699431 RepID=A0A0P7HYW5_9EURY|nr:hypothetical protein [Halolamina pelagica]KPN29521.1 hypothetical protein SY89_00234 [Halolamina pelagica]
MPRLDRVEPWHALLVAAFLVGTAGSLVGGNVAGIAVVDVLTAALTGLLWAFAVYVFVATFRNYVNSYGETDGSLWNPRFLAPFVAGTLTAVAIVVWEPVERASTGALIADGLMVGFWAFVLVMALILTGSYVVAGYREGSA